MRKFILLLSIFTIFLSLSSAQTKVKATGIGPSKKEAEFAAQRNAVEQGVGTFIDSETITKNFMLVKDKILSKSRGYVKNYEIISSEKQSDGNWKVIINAVVAKGTLKNDLDALGILREKMGNPKILIIYDSSIKSGISDPKNPIVSKCYDGIVEYLAEKEFPVVDETISKQFAYRNIMSSKKIFKEASKFGLNNQAEYILLFNLDKKRLEETSTFKRVRIIASAKILNTSTANIYASHQQKYLGVDKDSIEFAEKKAARNTGKLLGKFLSKKLIKRWESESVSGRPTILELKNIDDFSILVEFKSELKNAYGVKNIHQRRSTSKTVQYELTYTGEMSTLKNSIYKIFKNMDYEIAPPVSGGDRITVDFSKKIEDIEKEPAESEKDSSMEDLIKE